METFWLGVAYSSKVQLFDHSVCWCIYQIFHPACLCPTALWFSGYIHIKVLHSSAGGVSNIIIHLLTIALYIINK